MKYNVLKKSLKKLDSQNYFKSKPVSPKSRIIKEGVVPLKNKVKRDITIDLFFMVFSRKNGEWSHRSVFGD